MGNSVNTFDDIYYPDEKALKVQIMDCVNISDPDAKLSAYEKCYQDSQKMSCSNGTRRILAHLILDMKLRPRW